MDRSINTLHSWAGVFTWAVVFGLSIMVMWDASGRYADIMPEAIVLQLVFFGLMLAVISDRICPGPVLGKAFIILMLVVVVVLAWRTPVSFFFVYTIMWISIVPHYFSRRVSFGFLLLTALAWYVIMKVSWGENDVALDVLLFGTFHLFAMLSSLASKTSAEANERAQALNRELMATQHLLAEASKQNERTRIARDLHDLLGHHLTALTINLQVAGRLSEGEAKEKIDQCHGLSKLLLSDVRDAVTTLREESAVNFTETLKLFVNNVPNLKINLDIDPELNIDDVNIAEALLRCVQEAVTNTLRHANAKESWIKVWRENHELRLNIHDDGKAPEKVEPGNGLAGMRERIERLNGKLIVEALQHLTINVKIPLAQ